MEFEHAGDVRDGFDAVAERFEMDVRWAGTAVPKRTAILVSREEHCLLDLLWRVRRGDLFADVPVVISNHEDARRDVDALGVPFVHIPNDKTIREQAEAAMLQRLEGADVVVLARYMQILT